MTQFFLATNLAALTGRSQTSKVLTRVYERSILDIIRQTCNTHCCIPNAKCSDGNTLQMLKNIRSASHLCFMVPHTDTAIVQTGQHPWLGRMKVYAFDTVRSSRESALDVQPQRLEEKNQNHYYSYTQVDINQHPFSLVSSSK